MTTKSGAASTRYPFREAGRLEPGLALAQSFWALTEREIPMEASLEAAVEQGFVFFEAGLREDRMPIVRRLLRMFPMRLIAQGWAANAEEANVFFERAEELGAEALNLHLGHAYLSHEEAVALIDEVQERADRPGIPLVLETHRGRLTQDLYRTSGVIAARPDTTIALDVSHYLVAGEMLGGDEQKFHTHLDPVLRRTAMIHGRIASACSIQTHPEDAFAFAAVTKTIWQRAMELWLADAPADAVLVFEPELGPPPYAYCDLYARETFSRTEATAVLVKMAQEAWDAAHAARVGQ